LIEVLIAIVILSTGIVLVLRAFETSVVALGEARDSLWASLMIREKMDEVDAYRLANEQDPPSSASGSFSGRYEGFRWERDVARVSAAGETGGELDRVTVTVRRKGSSREYSATTYVRTPPDQE